MVENTPPDPTSLTNRVPLLIPHKPVEMRKPPNQRIGVVGSRKLRFLRPDLWKVTFSRNLDETITTFFYMNTLCLCTEYMYKKQKSCVIHSIGIRSVVDLGSDVSYGLGSTPGCKACEIIVAWMHKELKDNHTRDNIFQLGGDVSYLSFL